MVAHFRFGVVQPSSAEPHSRVGGLPSEPATIDKTCSVPAFSLRRFQYLFTAAVTSTLRVRKSPRGRKRERHTECAVHPLISAFFFPRLPHHPLPMSQQPKIDWFDISKWGVEGKGWADTQRCHDRLPLRAKNTVPAPVWDLSRSATGICALFESNAPKIHARWRLCDAQLGEPKFPVAGFSGLDLYADDRGRWRWCGAGQNVKDQKPRQMMGSAQERALAGLLATPGRGQLPGNRANHIEVPRRSALISELAA
jgi:hypothetical protein